MDALIAYYYIIKLLVNDNDTEFGVAYVQQSFKTTNVEGSFLF